MRNCFPGLFIAAVAAISPAAALADVMEINGGEAVWVVGGPKALPLESVRDDLVEGEPGTEPYPLSLTQISGTAGPLQFQARVAELAAKYDISPTLLEAVVWQESRWNQGAVSPVGARGLTQLMPGTARQMGVNPADASANLEGGARYLRLQLDAFEGDLEKALAAYNAGPARVQRAGGIPAIRETQNYVSSILTRLSAPVRK
jgi:soluble lytic murein transglycosylase-like protein